MASSTQILSAKSAIQNLGHEYEIKKNTYRGVRIVRVPKEVIEWSITNRDMLLSSVATLEVSLAFDSPLVSWKVEKSVYEVDKKTYIGFVHYFEGESVRLVNYIYIYV